MTTLFMVLNLVCWFYIIRWLVRLAIRHPKATKLVVGAIGGAFRK